MEDEQVQSHERPTAITVVCVLGFIGAAFTVPLLFSDAASRVGSWYPPYLAFSAAVGLACMIGLWNMKRWGAFGYTGFVLLNQAVLLVAGAWTPMALVMPMIVVGIALSNSSKMT